MRRVSFYLVIFSLLILSVVYIIVIYYPLIIFIYIFKYYFYFIQISEINLLKPITNLGPFSKPDLIKFY